MCARCALGGWMAAQVSTLAEDHISEMGNRRKSDPASLRINAIMASLDPRVKKLLQDLFEQAQW